MLRERISSGVMTACSRAGRTFPAPPIPVVKTPEDWVMVIRGAAGMGMAPEVLWKFPMPPIPLLVYGLLAMIGMALVFLEKDIVDQT